MVKKKSGRTLNPADAHRKAIRQKEIKKNKAERKRVRTLVMMHKDTSKLEEEITRYRTLDKEKWLDKNGKVKLKELEDKFSKILETKKAHGVSVTKDKPKDNAAITIFYHPTLNPSGLPPTADAGSLQSKSTEDSTTDDESITDSDESTDDLSNNDENPEEIDDTDEYIPLPPGSPPKQTNETSDSDDDKLPELPPGPPPSKKQFEISSSEEKGDENEDDDLPSLPPGPPPPTMQPQQQQQLRQQQQQAPPSSFGFYHSNHHHDHHPPPQLPFLLPADPFMMYNGPPPGSLNNQGQNMRPLPNSFLPATGTDHFGRLPPPPPPIHGQVFSSHSHNTPVSRPSPFSTKFLHYGPPQQQNQQSKQFSQINSSPNSISSSLSSFKSNTAVSSTNNNNNHNKTIASSSSSTPITAISVIQAEPQVRNLHKELTSLVPATLLRKKASNKPKVIRSLVNTAPNIDDGLVTSSSSTPSFTIPIKRPSSPSVITANIPLLQNQSSNDKQHQAPPPPKKSRTRKKVDEYEKFMAEMQDLL